MGRIKVTRADTGLFWTGHKDGGMQGKDRGGLKSRIAERYESMNSAKWPRGATRIAEMGDADGARDSTSMWPWALRGVLAAVAGLLVVATVPRSNLTAPAATPAPYVAATEAPVAVKASVTCRGLDDSGASPIPFPARSAAEV